MNIKTGQGVERQVLVLQPLFPPSLPAHMGYKGNIITSQMKTAAAISSLPS